jgi:hypothetical protein
MESRYKELFQKILPKIKFNFPEPEGIEYEIIYDTFMESEGTLSMMVSYKRITPKNKITVVPKVLNQTLYTEIRTISRYINLENKSVIIENRDNELV